MWRKFIIVLLWGLYKCWWCGFILIRLIKEGREGLVVVVGVLARFGVVRRARLVFEMFFRRWIYVFFLYNERFF